MSYFSSPFKLGILGGGQLGKMLLYTTQKWDIITYVLDPNEEAPARFACNIFKKGNLLDYATVYDFGKQVDVLTIEIENVNITALEQLEKEGIKIYPQPNILKQIQNKSKQKDFYYQKNIPTAPYTNFNNWIELEKAIKKQSINFPFVWKSAMMGYDGYGVQIIKNKNDLKKITKGACLVEDLIAIEKEFSVIICRNPSGDTKTYPVIEMEFHPEANQVEYIICPASIENNVAEKVKKIAQTVSESFQHIGLLAVEIFLTKKGDILVNEVAPRPHNSGHYTLEASYTSQFEQHIRSILDLPLGSTKSKRASVMTNLVGAENHTGNVFYKNIDAVIGIKGVNLHIYGKKYTHPFRKMGHINVIHHKIEKAYEIAKKVKQTLKVISKK